jgi:hypothetical protein
MRMGLACAALPQLDTNRTGFSGNSGLTRQTILPSIPAANREPAQADLAGEVIIDREVNRHAASRLAVHLASART